MWEKLKAGRSGEFVVFCEGGEGMRWEMRGFG